MNLSKASKILKLGLIATLFHLQPSFAENLTENQEQSASPAGQSKLPVVAEKTNITEEKKLPADDGSRVSVLGYHDFTTASKQNVTAMRISTKKFRAQMEEIKKSEVPVITIEDFIAWKRGEKQLPPQSILITIDDGWKSVYTEAYPILKEYGYPFTVYLYKRYINIGGRSMTHEMIEEMRKNGGTIGCHSVDHPFPSAVKKERRKGPEMYDKFLRRELGESKTYLESKYGQAVTTYAYPGGFYTDEMFDVADDYGYDALFTCLPGKVRRDSKIHTLPRYIVLGNHDSAFNQAMKFRSAAELSHNSNPATLIVKTPHPVSPTPGDLIQNRLPEISADLSKVSNLDPRSLIMRVTGFGQVPITYNPTTKQATWNVSRRLRRPSTLVTLQWKDQNTGKYQTPLSWTFQLDREAAYQPNAMN